MKAANSKKVPFGESRFSPIKRARYLKSEDAFEVEFEDGQKIVEPHETIRAANKVPPTARLKRLKVDDWTRGGFVGYYDNGQTAEVSWAFLRELPPKSETVASSPPSYSSDRPISSKHEDKLGRVEFASGLARDLRLWSGKDSLVLALYGEWGSGKTSIKNLLLEANKLAGNEALPIMQFNPWQLSGIGSIPNAFFRELQILLRTEIPGEHAERTAARLKVYASTLSLSGTAVESIGKALPWFGIPAGPAVEIAGKALKSAGSVAKFGGETAQAEKEAKARTLQDQKAVISKALAELSRPALVVIDDIDRLTTEEILQVFQVVKANADFPRLIYLLLFDRAIVARALNLVSGDKGTEFLEKIVQVGYHVPQASHASIERVLFQGLDAELDNEMVAKQWDKRRWSEMYLEGIRTYFKNLRHVYRFLSSFTFHVRHHTQTGTFEVNPIDLIALETLRVFEPSVYERLPAAKTILTRDNGKRLFGDIDQAVVDEAVSQITAVAAGGNIERVKAILEQLFPATGSGYAKRTDVSQHRPQWLRELRVCHPELFDRYFTLTIGEHDLAQAELEGLIASTGDPKAFETMFTALSERGLQRLAFERLDAYKELIPIGNLPALTLALCNISDQFPARMPGFFELDPLSSAWRLIYFGLKRELDEQRRFEILRSAIEKSRGLALPTDITSFEERIPERQERAHEFLVTEAHAAELRQVCVKMFKDSSRHARFAANPRLDNLLWWWSNWGDIGEVRKWIKQKIQTPKGVLWFLLVALGESHSWGGDHRIRYFINLSTIERYADLERVRALSARLKREKLSRKEQIALRELDKAVARRAEGKSDSAWQNDFRGEDDEIVE